MTELRQDYLTGQWVSIATKRGTRPSDYKKVRGPIAVESENCPFCPENRHLTSEEIYKHGRVRVIPNLYPVLDQSTNEGFGFHEVVVDTPVHNERLHEFSVEDTALLLETIRDRVEYYTGHEGVASVQVFKNEGMDAGATLAHSHWQILAMPIIPNQHKTVAANFAKYRKEHNSCYLCDIHKSLDRLIVCRQGDVVAYVPYASFFYYGVTVSTLDHLSNFGRAGNKTLENFAVVIKKVINAYYSIFKHISYNICFSNSPVSCDDKDWHFYFTVIPRVGNLAGFELTTGCYINSCEPEEAAAKLRETIEKLNL